MFFRQKFANGQKLRKWKSGSSGASSVSANFTFSKQPICLFIVASRQTVLQNARITLQNLQVDKNKRKQCKRESQQAQLRQQRTYTFWKRDITYLLFQK